MLPIARSRRWPRLAALFALLVILLLPACASAVRRDQEDEEWEERMERWRREHGPVIRADMQAFAGVSMLGDDELTFKDVSDYDPEAQAEADLSTAPLLGFASFIPVVGKDLDAGVELGMTGSWWTDSGSFRSSNGVAVVKLDVSLILADFFLGAYARAKIANAVRIYAGAGPLVMFGWYDGTSEELDPSGAVIEDDDSRAALGVGLYARGGVEVMLSRNASIGVGVRGISTELDFGGNVGDVEIEGLQAYAAFTFGL